MQQYARFTIRRLVVPVVVAVCAALLFAAPAMAQEVASEAGRDVVVPLVWSIVGVLLFCGALGVLYLLKRELGGFIPRPGAWTAPISVMPASTNPTEESDYPEHAGDGHGH